MPVCHKWPLRMIASASLYALVASGCAVPTGGKNSSPSSTSYPVSTARFTPACQLLLARQDIPPNLSSQTITLDECSDPRSATITYGQTGSLQRVSENLTTKSSSSEASASFESYVSALLIQPGLVESSPGAFDELGQQVRYFKTRTGDTFWNLVFVQQNRLLVMVEVVSYGAISSNPLMELVSKALTRAQPDA